MSTSHFVSGSEKSKLRPSGKSNDRKQRHSRLMPSGGAVSRKSSYEKLAAWMSKKNIPDFDLTDTLPGEVSRIVHGSDPLSPRSGVRTSAVPALRHGLKKRDNASSVEQFIHPLVKIFGRETAEFLAARFHWSLEPPSPELSSSSNARGRNYSARSREGKRPA